MARPRIVIIGGGFAGAYCALTLKRYAHLLAGNRRGFANAYHTGNQRRMMVEHLHLWPLRNVDDVLQRDGMNGEHLSYGL